MPADSHLTSSHGTFSATRQWPAVAELAAQQFGVVSLAQLSRLGVSPSAARSWAARGVLIRLHREVFAVGHAVLRVEGRQMAGVLACGEEAALSHRSAGGHHGMRQNPSSFVEVTVPRGIGRSRDGLRVHTGALQPDEVEREGIPCTTVARTLIDLAAVVSKRGLEAAVEAAERLEIFDLR